MKQLVPEDSDILHRTTIDIDIDNPQINLQELEEELFECMEHYNGVGLAANQIGYSYSAFAMLHEDTPMMVINPQIDNESDDVIMVEEGCLSYPGLYVKIKRPSSIATRYYDKDGQLLIGAFSELSARVFQHECDHIKGYVFHDLASQFHMKEARRKRVAYLRKMKKRNSVLWQSHLNNKKQKKDIQKTL